MKRAIATVAAGVLWVAGTSALAAPVVVTFDDLIGDGTVPAGYGGIQWGSEWGHYDDTQDPYTPASGLQRIYNFDRANPSSFQFTSPVSFLGAAIAGESVVDDVQNGLFFELYLGGVLQHTSATALPSGTPTFLSSGYVGPVDEVRVLSGTGDFYVLDNVTYDAAVATVPEPGSLALLALAGLALVGSSRPKRCAARA